MTPSLKSRRQRKHDQLKQSYREFDKMIYTLNTYGLYLLLVLMICIIVGFLFPL